MKPTGNIVDKINRNTYLTQKYEPFWIFKRIDFIYKVTKIDKKRMALDSSDFYIKIKYEILENDRRIQLMLKDNA